MQGRARLFSVAGLLVIFLLSSLVMSGFAETPKSIIVGGTLPLTGVFAETAKWIQKGYQQWADDVNAGGGLLGRPVELIIYDDTSNVGTAVTLLEKLITVDKVDLLLGGYPGTAAAAQMTVAEQYGRVYVSMGGHMPSFEQGYKYSFSATPLMGQWWAEGLGKWLESLPAEERPKSAAILSMNNIIGKSCRESIVGWLEELNIPILVDETYDLPLASADALVSLCKQSDAEAMFANGFFGDGVLTVRAMKSLNYSPKLFYQSIGNLVPAWVEQLGEDGDYVFSSTAIHHGLPYPGIVRLNEVCQEKYDQPYAPDYFLFGYSWVETLQQGVEGSASLDQDTIVDYLQNNPISIISGTYTFDEKGLPAPYGYLTQVLNGQVELVWPSEAATTEVVYPFPAWMDR
jgi:branched-chain amino acid transport system substrate-binding protein